MSTQETKPEPRRPKLRLPFDNRREDAGEWAFDHRAGLCVTLIAYLLLAIAFVGAKIVVGGRPAAQGFYIDLQQLEQLAAEKERLEREVRRRQQQEPIDWKSIRNDVSNENAKLDESLRDDRGTNTAALNDAADAAQERMRANREAYERGLAEAEAIRRRRERTDERGESSDRKVQGRVTVSFSLVDPVRHARHLVVPAYQCEGGGEVVVRITVNRAGEVTHASVASGGDDCMRETAVRAARNSVFDINDAAPATRGRSPTSSFRSSPTEAEHPSASRKAAASGESLVCTRHAIRFPHVVPIQRAEPPLPRPAAEKIPVSSP